MTKVPFVKFTLLVASLRPSFNDTLLAGRLFAVAHLMGDMAIYPCLDVSMRMIRRSINTSESHDIRSQLP